MIKLKPILLNELTSIHSPINDKLRIHVSNNPITELQNKDQRDSPMTKPSGLWYGFGRNWIEYILNTGARSEVGNYFYFVKIKDRNKLLQIKNKNELYQFVNNYYEKSSINWKLVKNDGFCGIETNPFLGDRLYYESSKYAWYTYWSIASGCIWDPSIIELKLIYPKTPQNL